MAEVTERPDSANRVAKNEVVATLAHQFRNSTASVLTEYRGLSVSQLKSLRRSLGDDASYAVTKNTLAKLAARDAGCCLWPAWRTGACARSVARTERDHAELRRDGTRRIRQVE